MKLKHCDKSTVETREAGTFQSGIFQYFEINTTEGNQSSN